MSATVSTEALESLPPFLVELLNNCPKQGSGVHQWIFKCAIHLLIHFDEATTVELIREKAAGCGRSPERLASEVRSQVKSALFCMWLPTYPHRYALRSERVRAFVALVEKSND